MFLLLREVIETLIDGCKLHKMFYPKDPHTEPEVRRGRIYLSRHQFRAQSYLQGMRIHPRLLFKWLVAHIVGLSACLVLVSLALHP